MTPGAPETSLFDAVVGQEVAVAALLSAAVNPVHAYLFRGAAGNGGLVAAHAFAAALLCPDGGCGHCHSCRSALDGSHPDLHVLHRTGASLSVDDARRMVTLAQRKPLQSARQVVVATDVHLATRAAPALLKTLEEPPGATVFVLLADDVPPELATVGSRCVQVPFPAVPRGVVVQWLIASGAPADLAAAVAVSSGGNPERARVMVHDPEVAARLELWTSVPGRLDGSGGVAAQLARQLLDATDRAVEPLRAEHARLLEVLTEEAESMGERGLPGRKEIVEHQQREERRWRADTLRAGLGALARAYRDAMMARLGGAAAHAPPGLTEADALRLIDEAAQTLPRNPNETLLLQALLVRLGTLGA